MVSSTLLHFEPLVILAKVLSFINSQAYRLLDALATLFVPVTPHFVWRPLLQDPDDEMILEAAVTGQVEVIVTFTSRPFRRAAPRFGIEVLLPADFLRSVRHADE